MKAIFVESYNCYLAQSPKDDMSWTPSLDKKIFKLLTYVYGGICVCSSNTFELLPKKMIRDTGREFIIAEHSGPNSLIELNKKYPNAVLVGGPKFLKAAYEARVIDTFIVTTTNTSIRNNKRYEDPFIDLFLKLGSICTIPFDNMVINIYDNTNGGSEHE